MRPGVSGVISLGLCIIVSEKAGASNIVEFRRPRRSRFAEVQPEKISEAIQLCEDAYGVAESLRLTAFLLHLFPEPRGRR
jgi:hypothetical protein